MTVTDAAADDDSDDDDDDDNYLAKLKCLCKWTGCVGYRLHHRGWGQSSWSFPLKDGEYDGLTVECHCHSETAARAPTLRTAPRICQACWATSTWKRCARMLQREQLDKCRCPFLTVTFNPLIPFPGTGCGACIYIYIIDWLHYFALSLEPGHCQNCQLYHAVSHDICSHNYTHIHTHIHIHIHIYIYNYVWLHTHIYIYVYLFTHTHTHVGR